MRVISSTRSASPPISGRQDGTAAFMRPFSRSVSNPSASRISACRSAGTSTPPRVATRSLRNSTERFQSGMAPADVGMLVSPPQNSRIRRAATSAPHSADSGSTPRSNRYRASDSICSLRPVVATETGSKSATSRKTSVVSSVQLDSRPPMTPAKASAVSPSPITVISLSSVYSFSTSAMKSSPSRARRMIRVLFFSLPASKTCSGRPRSRET